MQGWFRSGGREWVLLLCAAILFLAVLAVPAAIAFGESFTAEELCLAAAYERDEIIRLHVLANSDLPYDQSVKLAVRDALTDAFGDLLIRAAAHGSDEAYEALRTHLPDMLQVAKRCAAEYGFTGEITAEVGRLHLPQKAYGQIVLPEGEYRALRVILGRGAGENWWCVLYPQLCLALAEEGSSDLPRLPQWNTSRILKNWLLQAQ